MPVHFEWLDEQKRALRFIAEGTWNWKDYHQAVRAAAFSLSGVEHPVDCIIDLRPSARPSLPAGAAAHLRSFGRRTHACLTGRAALIGLPATEADRLGFARDRRLPTVDGFVQLVASAEQLEELLVGWAADPPEH